MCSLAAGLLVIPYMIYYMYPTMTVDVLLVGLRAISTGFFGSLLVIRWLDFSLFSNWPQKTCVIERTTT